jgi:SAM-dependent methyltransferase
LLAALQPYGWRTYGIEPSQPFATRAASRPGVALAATAAEAQEASWPAADLVLSFHTIEHVRDPRRELELLRHLMRPGAALVLLTPNGQSLNARLFRREWEWTSPPVHLHLFSRESLSRVLQDAGFRVERSRTVRGNAKGFLFELLRSGTHRVIGLATGAVGGSSSGPLHSTRPWYRTAEALAEAVSLPFWPLSLGYRALGLAPELRVVATAE